MINFGKYYFQFINENRIEFEEKYLFFNLSLKLNELRKKENNIFIINNNFAKEKYNFKNDNLNIEKINDFLENILSFLLEENKQFKNSQNINFNIYYISTKKFYAEKGKFLSRKYNYIEKEKIFNDFLMNLEKDINYINNDKKKMSQKIINQKDNKLLNILKLNYNSLTKENFFITLSTIGIISLGIISTFYLYKKHLLK